MYQTIVNCRPLELIENISSFFVDELKPKLIFKFQLINWIIYKKKKKHSVQSGIKMSMLLFFMVNN